MTAPRIARATAGQGARYGLRRVGEPLPAVRWLEHFPLLEPLFDSPVGLDDNGAMTPPETSRHGLRRADGAREDYLVDG